MFRFAEPRAPRRPSLTPMVDVVFLLVVFFMLVARFGTEQGVALGLAGGGDWEGPPRLLEVAPEGLRLNGVAMPPREALVELVRLTETGADPVVLRPVAGASVQRLVSVMELLEAAGFSNLAIVEAR